MSYAFLTNNYLSVRKAPKTSLMYHLLLSLKLALIFLFWVLISSYLISEVFTISSV